MFKHEKMLFHPVAVEKANPQYAALLQEQLGGANGELKAAMQYMSQSFRIKDQEIKDLFLEPRGQPRHRRQSSYSRSRTAPAYHRGT